jgi:hypothetical protein
MACLAGPSFQDAKGSCGGKGESGSGSCAPAAAVTRLTKIGKYKITGVFILPACLVEETMSSIVVFVLAVPITLRPYPTSLARYDASFLRQVYKWDKRPMGAVVEPKLRRFASHLA